MIDIDEKKLDFAYKYPFTRQAKELVKNIKEGFNLNFLKAGKTRLEEDLNKETLEISKTTLIEIKYTYFMSYIYSRMLVSALNNKSYISKFAHIEARRSVTMLEISGIDDLNIIVKELGLSISQKNDQYAIKFETFLSLAPKNDQFSLVKQHLKSSYVYLNLERLLKLIERAIAIEIAKGLPIPLKELPKEVISLVKNIELPVEKVSLKPDTGSYSWIEKLLAVPIADVRHRTVNLILAPYLVNIRKLNEDQAAIIIINYIEKCKQIEMNTKINSTYIKYQCRYAKIKGLKPLSIDKAKELLSGVINLDVLMK